MSWIRVIIICEGHTERDFCKKFLEPYFSDKCIKIESPLIGKSNGGIVKWIGLKGLKQEISNHIKTNQSAFVTTFVDYYGLTDKLKLPMWNDSKSLKDLNKRVEKIEAGMFQDINDSIRYRFIPYIQLHEFEALLFSDLRVFNEKILKTSHNSDYLKSTIENYDNPEMINNNRETSPSNRLKRIIPGFRKKLHADILVNAIGIDRIRKKCPRFDNWLDQIEGLTDR